MGNILMTTTNLPIPEDFNIDKVLGSKKGEFDRILSEANDILKNKVGGSISPGPLSPTSSESVSSSSNADMYSTMGEKLNSKMYKSSNVYYKNTIRNRESNQIFNATIVPRRSHKCKFFITQQLL